ncbi:MAG: RdgB/HAM1 family non-canonical purine NTP pyrophosphatase [Simkaniaceae bacterium]
MKLVLATTNLHKIHEIKAMLKEYKQFDIYTLRDFPHYTPPEETGLTFEENAILKASHASKALDTLCLADDSGLSIPALNGEPGVKSKRYAGESAKNSENLKKLVEKLSCLPEKKRFGYFECSIALANNGELVKSVKGQCEGKLITIPRGKNGFGYDSLFIKYDYNKTLAELETDIKNRISHRRKALDKILLALECLI